MLVKSAFLAEVLVVGLLYSAGCASQSSTGEKMNENQSVEHTKEVDAQFTETLIKELDASIKDYEKEKPQNPPPQVEKDSVQYKYALQDMEAGDYETALNRLHGITKDFSRYQNVLDRIKECEEILNEQRSAECERHWSDCVDFISLYPETSDEKKIRIYRKHLQKYPDSPHKEDVIKLLKELGVTEDQDL